MKLPFDAKQTEAIRVQGNAVVMAGAGSGKTAVISERYCRLLEKEGMGVDRILALTFTQKAAAEMYERIYRRLRTAPQRLRKHLQAFDQAQISTLDSFCAEILTQACERFGLPEDFRYDEQAVTRQAERLSLEFLLENLDLPAVQTLLHVHGFENLWQDLLKSLAGGHLHLPGHFDFPSMARSQIDRCRLDLADQLLAVRSWIDQLLKLDPRTASIRDVQETLSGFPGIAGDLDSGRYSEAAEKLDLVKLKKPGGRGGDDIQLMKSLIDRLRPGLKMLSTLAATLHQEPTLLEVFSLLENFAFRFLEGKRTSGLIGFQDGAELAVEALVRDKALRQFYKNKFRYIMIDEFQDNNRLQRDLLFLLAEKLDAHHDGVPPASDLEPDKLLFVGDEKQSIYRFRGAEVSVFKSLHDQLKAAGGRTVALERNYRSASELVEFVNHVFASVMADPRADYEARYQRMTKGGPEVDVPAQIHLFYGIQEQPPDSDTAPANLAEAHAVVRFIRRCVEEKTLSVASEQGIRPAGYDDFAVLLRSTGNQIHYERMLRHFDVPYATDNLRSLFAEAPINDFYLLLQLAVYPEDRPAYAGLLRSPFVNISDETSIRLLLAGNGGQTEPFADIEELETSPEDRRRLERGRETYLWVREAVDRISIAEIFHNLWYRHGYRYTILRNPRNHNYLEYYEYMVKLAERADSQGDSLAVFLDFLRQNLGRYERIDDLTVLRPRRPGVQLLTIHRSKGLEFPIVVLADTGNLGRPRRHASNPYYVSSRYGITVNLGSRNYFTEIGERESENEELAEIKRLLYVALTRAQSHLIIAGTHKLKNRTSPRAHLNLLLQSLGYSEQPLKQGGGKQPGGEKRPNLEIHGIEALKWGQLIGKSCPRIVVTEPRYAGTPVLRTAPRREISVTELCVHLEPIVRPRQGKAAPSAPGQNLPAVDADPLLKELDLESRFGILTHQLLSRWSRDPGGVAPQPDWTRIPREHRDRLLASALVLCRNFFDSQLGALFRQSTRVQRESPFLYLYEDAQGPLYISGQIDLSFELQDRLYLVDFKTDRRYRAGEHECQLALYRLAAAEQTEMEIFPFLFLLRSAQALCCDAQIDLAEWIPRIRGLL